MSLFDDFPRATTDLPDHNETAFAYLNRSARVEANRVRTLADIWFSHYPSAHRESLAARFRSSIDDQHRSAFFELFLHELVLTRGHKVLEIEPKLTHTSKSPDFLVESDQGHRFYLEAVLATGRSQDDAAAQARLNQALAALDNTPSPAHFLDISPQGMPAAAPVSINKMKRALLQWVNALPPDDTAIGKPPFVYDEHGLRVVVRPFPRRNRPGTGRSIGVRHFPVQEVTVDEDIRAALEKKASRYGDLDHPYLVAVNALGLFHREDEALDALFGTTYTAVSQFTDGTFRTDERRKPDGIWFGPQGPRRKGLSAVLSTEQIDPWNFAARRARLICNPWSTAPLPSISLGVDEFNLVDDAFRRTDGTIMGSIFGLPEGWPRP
jgi:hypothetical protein